MSEGNLMTGDFKLSQLSFGPADSPWAIAVFAHNEAKTIQRALESIGTAVGNQEISIYVLANGCTDTTIERVHQSAAKINNLWLLESKVADKASAWNLFVHEVLSNDRLAGLDVCFFMDGDVTLAVDALEFLAVALEQVPSAEAAGAMPATGRNKDVWRQRMPMSGMLAGNCYALRSSFIQQIKERPVRMPVGLIGEDFFVSWLVASNVWRKKLTNEEDVRCIFHKEAEFAFRSLSPWSLTDCRTYLRRKWRYTLRGLQHQMLILLLMRQGLEAMPRDVNELYKKGPLPSRLSWCGADTLLRFIAVLWIRAQRKRSGAEAGDLRTYRE